MKVVLGEFDQENIDGHEVDKGKKDKIKSGVLGGSGIQQISQGAEELFRLLCYANQIYWLTWRTHEYVKDTAER